VDSEYTNGLQGVVCSPDRNSDSTWFANDLFPRFTMRLKMVTIRGFRSIQATIQVPIDRNVTILIGANDHGKSNVLSAIRCLNDENGFQQNDVNWDLLEDATTPEIEWKFELNVDTALGDPSGPQDSSENRVRASSRVADSDSEKGRSAAHDTMPSVVVFRRSGVGAAVVAEGRRPLVKRTAKLHFRVCDPGSNSSMPEIRYLIKLHSPSSMNQPMSL